jgi:fumarate reductase flavoprotein subunit
MKTLKTQVVIVGSGSAGLSAGFDLYQKKIPFIMLERGDKVGGAGKFGAHGVFAVHSKQQLAKGVTYDYADAFKGLTEYNHYFVNGELLARFLKLSGENIERMDAMGLSTTVEQSEQKAHLNDPLVYHKFNNFKSKMDTWDAWPQKFADAGNPVLTETWAVGLDYDSDNGLKAVLAKNKDDEDLRLEASKVIFADGGYCGSPEMMATKYPDNDALLNLGERKADGTGIKLCAKYGANVDHNPVLFAHGCAPSLRINPMRRQSSVETLTNLPLLWVDQTGNRFVNEDIVYDFAMWANAAHNVNGKYSVILDQATLDHFKENVVPMEDTFERQFLEPGQTPTGTVGPIPNIQADFDDAIVHGEVVKADTIEELAEKLGLPLSALKRTLKVYNQAIADGKDDTFLKSPDELKFGVEQGPFYAIKERCAILGTLDGVHVDRNCQPVTKAGQPLKDLYIVGNNVNGLYSDGYPSYEGIANGFAFVSGWIAATEAGKAVQEEK